MAFMWTRTCLLTKLIFHAGWLLHGCLVHLLYGNSNAEECIWMRTTACHRQSPLPTVCQCGKIAIQFKRYQCYYLLCVYECACRMILVEWKCVAELQSTSLHPHQRPDELSALIFWHWVLGTYIYICRPNAFNHPYPFICPSSFCIWLTDNSLLYTSPCIASNSISEETWGKCKRWPATTNVYQQCNFYLTWTEYAFFICRCFFCCLDVRAVVGVGGGG